MGCWWNIWKSKHFLERDGHCLPFCWLGLYQLDIACSCSWYWLWFRNFRYRPSSRLDNCWLWLFGRWLYSSLRTWSDFFLRVTFPFRLLLRLHLHFFIGLLVVDDGQVRQSMVLLGSMVWPWIFYCFVLVVPLLRVMVVVWVGLLVVGVCWCCLIVLVRLSALPTHVMVLALLSVLVITALFFLGPHVLCQQPVHGIELLATVPWSVSLVYPFEHYGIAP